MFDSLGHINVVVSDLDEATEFYRPTLISTVTPDQIVLPGPGDQKEAKESLCAIVRHIRFFYALDPYGIQWESEQGHQGIG